MKRFFREPLFHFLMLGAMLFVAYGWLNGGLRDSGNDIVVSRGQQLSLQAQFERVWQRPPTAAELHGLVDGWVREEILYREGVVMGFDRDDPIVRRRVAQKVEFIVDGMVPTAPTEEELQAWIAAHPERYAIEPTYTFRQVFFDPALHANRLEADVDAARRSLEKNANQRGDTSMLPARLNAVGQAEVSRIFGSEFADALKTLPAGGGWQGPVASGFGVHLVLVSARTGERAASLNEVRGAVERDLLRERSQQASEAYYQRLRSSYNVRIDASADAAGSPTG